MNCSEVLVTYEADTEAAPAQSHEQLWRAGTRVSARAGWGVTPLSAPVHIGPREEEAANGEHLHSVCWKVFCFVLVWTSFIC